MLKPLQDFLRLEAAGGLVLMGATVFALLVANSPLAAWYSSVFEIRLVLGIGSLHLGKPLLLWINDGLMAVFFFLVGMELKREILEGHLSSLRAASMPAFAALGGMVVPALFYVFFTRADPVAVQWLGHSHRHRHRVRPGRAGTAGKSRTHGTQGLPAERGHLR